MARTPKVVAIKIKKERRPTKKFTIPLYEDDMQLIAAAYSRHSMHSVVRQILGAVANRIRAEIEAKNGNRNRNTFLESSGRDDGCGGAGDCGEAEGATGELRGSGSEEEFS